MKKNLIISVILFISSINILLADNWEPFPYNKTLIYTHNPYIEHFYNNSYEGTTFGDDEYFDVIFDSMYVNGNSKTYYSDRYRRHQQLPCINDTFDFTCSLRGYYSPYYFQEDFYTIRNDTAIFNINYDHYLVDGQLLWKRRRDIFFPLNMQQGDTFTQEFQFRDDTTTFLFVTIKYISKIEEIIFGQKDSIKFFEFYRGARHNDSRSIIDTIYMKFSKTFGFIDFMPFFYLYPKDTQYWWPDPSFTPHITLVGVKDSVQTLGIQMPDSVTADELVTLNVGDVIKWQNTQCPDKSYNRLDSVMSIKRTKDSIFITYFQILYDTLNTMRPPGGWRFSSVRNEQYSIKQYLELFNGPTNDAFLYESRYNHRWVFHRLFKKKVVLCDGDTTTQVSMGYNGSNVDTSNCDVGFSTDVYLIQRYNAKFGLSTYTGSTFLCKVILNWGQGDVEVILDQYMDEAVIVGYRIGGKVCGDISMPDTALSVKEIVDNPNPIVYPNPARDYIYINSNTIEQSVGMWEYQIYDILGNCVQTGTVESNKINISRLSSGFYTVRFFSGSKQVVEKMMKE